MEWRFCDPEGEIIEKNLYNSQVDESGNILYKNGSLKTKACQECKKEFISKSLKDELRQDVDGFKCTKCKFETLNSQDALTHLLKEKDHDFKVESESKVVGYNVTLHDHAIVEKKDDDYVILCKSCFDL